MPVNTDVPQTSALAAQTGAVTPHTPHATPHSPVPPPTLQNRGKRGKTKNTDNNLPSIENAINTDLDIYTTKRLNNILDDEIKDLGTLFDKR